MDHWIVDDVPDSVLETPASPPVVSQKAAKKGAKVLGKGEDARGKDKERDCMHPEPSQGKLIGELWSRESRAFVGDSGGGQSSQR